MNSNQPSFFSPREARDLAEDAELVRRAKAGDLPAMEQLAERHEERVFSLAMRMLRHQQDAEDVTQQTFLSALEHLESFRGESSFGTWLMRIAAHAALKVIRKRKGLPTDSLDVGADREDGFDHVQKPVFIADWRQSTDYLVKQNETRRLIEEALDQLDENHRLVFVLRDVEGLSVKETAETLGISEANAKVRLLRARLKLREILTRSLGDPSRQITRSHTHDHEA